MYTLSKIQIIVLTLLISGLFVLPSFAQQTGLSTEDQIRATKKLLIELNERLIREKADENARLKRELGETGADVRVDRAEIPDETPPGTIAKREGEPRDAAIVGGIVSGPNEGTGNRSEPLPAFNVNRPPPARVHAPTVTAAAQQQEAPDPSKCEKVLTLDRKSYGRLDLGICLLARQVARDSMHSIGAANSMTEFMTIVSGKLVPPDTVASDNIASTREQKRKSFFIDAEKKRNDKQIGSSPGANGTTSLVVKGGMPAIIGSAVENGSTTSTIDGNTVTFRVNPLGFSKAFFQKQSLFQITEFNAQQNDFIADQLKKVSFGFSFDTTRGRENPALVISRRQLSAFSVRYEFLNHRNPLSARYKTEREAFFDSQKENTDRLVAATNRLIQNQKFVIPQLQDMLEKMGTAIASLNLANQTEISQIEMIRGAIEPIISSVDWTAVGKDPRVWGASASYFEAANGFVEARQAFLDKINKGSIVTFEYTNFREVNKPDTSNFRFIAEKGTIGNIDLTLNASLTMFNKKPLGAGVNRLRDFDFALQADVPLDNYVGIPSTLSFAGRYLRQQSNAVTEFGFVAPQTSGDIATGQIKFTIPIRNTGIKLPLSFTFANRSDLVKEHFSRGNFGITFDLDKLFAPFDIFK